MSFFFQNVQSHSEAMQKEVSEFMCHSLQTQKRFYALHKDLPRAKDMRDLFVCLSLKREKNSNVEHHPSTSAPAPGLNTAHKRQRISEEDQKERTLAVSTTTAGTMTHCPSFTVLNLYCLSSTGQKDKVIVIHTNSQRNHGEGWSLYGLFLAYRGHSTKTIMEALHPMCVLFFEDSCL